MSRIAFVGLPGAGGTTPPALALTPEALGRLMPMFLWLDRHNRVRALGPTLEKILGPETVGTEFAHHFTLRRARGGAEREAETLAGGRRLGMTLLRYPAFNLRGSAVNLAGVGPGSGDVLVNLTFGIQLGEAVRFFGLTEADFAASDLVMELLFLSEAKAAVLSELRALTGRLDDARREAETEAMSDPLTGLANRRAFDAALTQAMEAQGRGGRNFTLLHLDLDYFKQVNDTLGHAAGDAVLIRAAHVLRDETRRGDLVARVGGDEFMVLVRGPSDLVKIEALSERLIAGLEEPMEIEGEVIRISASIGVALSDGCRPLGAEKLMAVADSALYASKRAGRGRWTIGDP